MHSFVLFSSLEHGVNRDSPGLLDRVTTDLWTPDSWGSAPRRLSSFNVFGAPQHDGFRAVVSKLGTIAEGDRLVHSLWRVRSESTSADDLFEIRVADLARR